jgi:hypothetical protein
VVPELPHRLWALLVVTLLKIQPPVWSPVLLFLSHLANHVVLLPVLIYMWMGVDSDYGCPFFFPTFLQYILIFMASYHTVD